MKSLYLTLFFVVALNGAADISLGFGNRITPPAEPARPEADLQALPQAVQAVAGEKAAAAAQKQLSCQQAAMEKMVQQYHQTVQRIDTVAPQVEQQLQQKISEVHTIGTTAPPPAKADVRVAPPLRPLPQELVEPAAAPVYEPLTPEVAQEVEQLLEAAFKNTGITKQTITITKRGTAETQETEVLWFLPDGMDAAAIAKRLPACMRVLQLHEWLGGGRNELGKCFSETGLIYDCEVELRGKKYVYTVQMRSK